MVTVCYFEATPGKLIVEFGLVKVCTEVCDQVLQVC